MTLRSLTLPLVGLLVAAAAAPAATPPAAKCVSKRVKSAGRELRQVLRCHAKAAATGVGVDPECVARGEQRAAGTFAKLDAAGGCPATLDAPAGLAAYLAGRAGAVAASLMPTSGGSGCQSTKIAAAARRANSTLKAHARSVKAPQVARQKVRLQVTKLRAQFDDQFAAAEAGGGCVTVGDAVGVAGEVDALLDAVAGRVKLVVRSTEVLPASAEPPNTPGSPGVGPSANPKLVAQFGGPSFSLNTVTYTRWRLGPVDQQPDAVLVTVPGFGGGAGNFEALAENLITRALEDHGLLVELWGYDRRTEQLEDRAGALLAGSLGDPLVALDWYYGTELGLPLHPALAAGPNRRAVFYNTTTDVPFIANWTGLVFSRDIDVVVQAARVAARNQNVFLGGHSAGTGFAARYAATDFNLTGSGPADPGYARLRGVVLFEGTGGSTGGAPLSSDSLDRMEAKADGGLFGAVHDGAARCVDGVTPCTVATEAAACSGQTPPVCTPSTPAHGVILGLAPQILAAAEPGGVQGITDSDTGQVILQVDQGAPGNNAIAKVPELALLAVLPLGTVEGTFGFFLDDESPVVALSPALAASVGTTGPMIGGLQTWLDRDEKALWPPCPGVACITPYNGAQPTTLPGTNWGVEREQVRIDRLGRSFSGVEGANSSDWYYPISGLSTTSAAGVCSAGTCTKGNVGAACANDAACGQAISLDSSALSIGRGRRDIENLTQAAAVDIPFLGIGGSNGLVPVAGRFRALADSLGTCAAPSCAGAPRVIDPALPNPAFPTFGGVDGGFEVVIAEGYAHIDVVAAEDDSQNPIVAAVARFMARNIQ